MSYPEKRDGKLTGYWYGEVRTKSGLPRARRRFETKKEADGYEAYVKATGQEPPHTSGEVSGLTWAAVAAEYKEKGPWSSGRDISVTQRAGYLCSSSFGKLPIEKIDYSALEKLAADLGKRPGRKGKPLTPATINRYLTPVSEVLRYAARKGYIKATPEVPWQREPRQPRILWLTEAAEDQVVGTMLDRGWHAEALSVRFLVATGLRWGEFETLAPTQIEEEVIRLWETKTNTPRSVPIAPELAREMRALVASGKKPEYKTFCMRFREACKSCGQSEGFTPHCLRHTTATRLAWEGVRAQDIQAFMGHSSINTTMRYVHMFGRDLSGLAKKLSPRRGQLLENAEVIPYAGTVKSVG